MSAKICVLFLIMKTKGSSLFSLCTKLLIDFFIVSVFIISWMTLTTHHLRKMMEATCATRCYPLENQGSTKIRILLVCDQSSFLCSTQMDHSLTACLTKHKIDRLLLNIALNRLST